MINNFLTCPADCDTPIQLGATPTNVRCTKFPIHYSQIRDWILKPSSVAAPSDVSSPTEWAAVIDNSDTLGTSAKHTPVIGGIPPPEKQTFEVSGRKDVTGSRLYTLTMTTKNVEAFYDFARQIQCGSTDFEIWYGTENHLYGGADGIYPSFLDADLPKNAGKNDIEEITFIVQFEADGDPPRVATPF